MIDVRLLRSDAGAVRAALARRGKKDVLELLDEALRHDVRAREITAERDGIRRNTAAYLAHVEEHAASGE